MFSASVTDQHRRSYRAVLPVADNLLQIGGGVKQEMLPPFIPVQSHGAVHVNTAHRQKKKKAFPSFLSKILNSAFTRSHLWATIPDQMCTKPQ